MRDFLRFALSSEDQARIDKDSIRVKDVDFSGSLWPRFPQPQSLHLTFKIKDPENGAPQIYPLFPGKLQFRNLRSESDASSVPNPEDVKFTSESFAGWSTIGTLGVFLTGRYHKEIQNHARGMKIIPNSVWYHPIQLTEQFLFETIVGHSGDSSLDKYVISQHIPPYKISHRTQKEIWEKHAVSYFLQGFYNPLINIHPSDQNQDDVAVLPLPTVVMNEDSGDVQLNVTMAFTGTPHEGEELDFFKLELFRNPNGDGKVFWPHHPKNGIIPARLVYQNLGPDISTSPPTPGHLINASHSDALLRLILERTWGRKYKLVRFTRSWITSKKNGEQIVDFSPHLARQKVKVATSGSDNQEEVLWYDYLPAHGLVYLPLPQENEDSVVQASLEDGDMYWVWGEEFNNWREIGHRNPLTFGIEIGSPQIVLRRPMGESILLEKFTGSGCTYNSLRRTIRAMIDNRIAGGRLIRLTETSLVRELLEMAWPDTEPGAKPNQVLRKRPDPEQKEEGSKILRKVLIRFFGVDNGRIASNLWHTSRKKLLGTQTSDQYDEHYIGCGAPGAFAFLDLVVGHSPEQYSVLAEENSNLLLSGEVLKPGALLQFWENHSDWQDIRDKDPELLERVPRDPSNPTGPTKWKRTLLGHSLVFHSYITDNQGKILGIKIHDQNKFNATECYYITPTTSNLKEGIYWGILCPDVWIAANWRD